MEKRFWGGPRPGSLFRIVTPMLILFYFSTILTLDHEPARADSRRALLIPGKKTLYQRVITHPGAHLYEGASTASAVRKGWIRPFTAYYVFATSQTDATQWLEVGLAPSGTPDGWIEAGKTSPWLQALTLKFTERTGRQPVLFFKDMVDLEAVAADRDPAGRYLDLMTRFADYQSGDDQNASAFPLVAMEPKWEAVSRDQFYLMPIFQAAELFEGVKFLQVASIDPGSGELPLDLDLKTAIAFVVDTTISMKPYIERTRESVRRIYATIEKRGLTDKVAFGLVGYRNSVANAPELEYVSRVYSDLRKATDRDAFEGALASMEEASVSTHSFNEDAFAGLKTALERLDWGPYHSRLIFLITDAGAIRNDDPYSSTGMNANAMADMAAAAGVKIFALHLKTPPGARETPNNHNYAHKQYQTLTRQSDPTIGDLYVPIDAEDATAGVLGFGQVVEDVAGQMVALVQATASGQRLALDDVDMSQPGDVATQAAKKAAILGYALQLDFLGRQGAERVPQVVTSWVSDMDITRPDIPTFEVTILLSKNQLSDLHHRLKIILDNAQRTKRTGARDFFQSILSAAAQTSRDPTRFSQRPNQNLGQLGFLAEFLDDLPYRSNIMRLTEEDWYRLSVGEQQAIVDDIKSKIRRYEAYHNDVSNWVSFGPGEPGDAVYRVPLGMMP
ncbi:MAG: VWA domain-containing protein [Desulfosarcina sp.]|nr:VWA domain-containing protein [Desulfosarcina sp.]